MSASEVSVVEAITLLPGPVTATVSKKTRQSSAIFGFGNGITELDAKITGSRLPTSMQVLRCLMWHIETGVRESRTRFQSAKMVLSQIVVFYAKSNIPMISEIKSCQRLLKLLDDNAKLRAIPIKRRSTAGCIAKVQKMKETLYKTFALWPCNAEQLIKNTEDLRFLESMKTDRAATFGSRDKLLSSKIERRQKRMRLEDLRREKHSTINKLNTVRRLAESDCDSHSDDSRGHLENESAASVPSGKTPRSHHRSIRTGTPAFIPHDIIQRPKLIAVSTRLKITPTQQVAYTSALIAEAGGDSSKVSASYSTADKSRRRVVRNIATAYRDQWLVPKLLTLHWDSKLMPSLSNKNISEERLTVLVGNAHELKLLGVPAYQPGTDRKSGDIVADLTVDLLSSWKCGGSVVNMTFDTTASNTGHMTAACVTIQQRLGRALLWSACRHHVGEVILSHVFDDLKIETSKSPEITVFVRFRKHFELLGSHRSAALHSSSTATSETVERLSLFDNSEFDETARDLVDSLRTSVLELSRLQQSLCRDDYLEFVELCIVFLDGEGVGETRKQITFKRPGALHKARWMAKLIYSIKMCLFEEQIQEHPRGTIATSQQMLKLRNFVNFVTLVYSSWWMSCNSVKDAPWNDLKFYQSMLAYAVVNPEISQSAIHAFKRHLWYLTTEMIPLALWSDKVPADERRALADRLLAVKSDNALITPQHRFGTGFGKPRFPTDTITMSTTLADLVGPDSWFIFYNLQLDSEFLMHDVAHWAYLASFNGSLINLNSINVVNDCAERGVKLSSDFLASSKREGHYQNVLQVVEQDRRRQPDLRKWKK